MTHATARCLILACGNTLRSDDGIGPWLAQWAEEKFSDDPTIRVISRQQWTPDLAENIAQADSILFLDCSMDSAPGSVHLIDIEPSAPAPGLTTHQLGAHQLLALSHELYNFQSWRASLLTIGAGSTELGETFSEPVLDAIPEACRLLEQTILNWLQAQDHRK